MLSTETVCPTIVSPFLGVCGGGTRASDDGRLAGEIQPSTIVLDDDCSDIRAIVLDSVASMAGMCPDGFVALMPFRSRQFSAQPRQTARSATASPGLSVGDRASCIGDDNMRCMEGKSLLESKEKCQPDHSSPAAPAEISAGWERMRTGGSDALVPFRSQRCAVPSCLVVRPVARPPSLSLSGCGAYAMGPRSGDDKSYSPGKEDRVVDCGRAASIEDTGARVGRWIHSGGVGVLAPFRSMCGDLSSQQVAGPVASSSNISGSSVCDHVGAPRPSVMMRSVTPSPVEENPRDGRRRASQFDASDCDVGIYPFDRIRQCFVRKAAAVQCITSGNDLVAAACDILFGTWIPSLPAVPTDCGLCDGVDAKIASWIFGSGSLMPVSLPSSPNLNDSPFDVGVLACTFRAASLAARSSGASWRSFMCFARSRRQPSLRAAALFGDLDAVRHRVEICGDSITATSEVLQRPPRGRAAASIHGASTVPLQCALQGGSVDVVRYLARRIVRLAFRVPGSAASCPQACAEDCVSKLTSVPFPASPSTTRRKRRARIAPHDGANANGIAGTVAQHLGRTVSGRLGRSVVVGSGNDVGAEATRQLTEALHEALTLALRGDARDPPGRARQFLEVLLEEGADPEAVTLSHSGRSATPLDRVLRMEADLTSRVHSEIVSTWLREVRFLVALLAKNGAVGHGLPRRRLQSFQALLSARDDDHALPSALMPRSRKRRRTYA